MDTQNSDNEVVEDKSSGLFSLPAAFIKKLYTGSEQLSDMDDVSSNEGQYEKDNESSNKDLSETSNSLNKLINDVQIIFQQDAAFDSIKNMVREITDVSESNYILIALANVLNKISDKYLIEKQDLLFELPLIILTKFTFTKDYQAKSNKLQKQCKKIQSVDELNVCLQAVYDLLFSVYQDTHADKKELEKFLSKIGAQINRIGENLHTVTEEQASDLKAQGELNLKMNNAVGLISENINAGSDLASLKDSVKGQLDVLQNIVEEERQIVKAQETRVHNNMKMLAKRVNELKQEAQSLRDKVQSEREQALRDPLTGLYNRQAYNKKISEFFTKIRENDNDLSLLIWDIDNFKKFNDIYGHVVGDKVLKSVAHKLNESLKDEYFLARYGGEEFAMLLPVRTVEQAKEFAEFVRNEVSDITFMVKDKKVKITISCGISTIQDHDTPQSIFERADKALYLAKEEGRNRVNIYKP